MSEELPREAPPPADNRLAAVVTGIFALGLFVGGLLMVFDGQRPNQLVNDGVSAPEVTFQRLDGSAVSLSALRGKVVVVDFWATWCPPCVEEMPELVQVGEEYAAKDVVLLAVSEDDGDARAIVTEFAHQHVPGVLKFAVLSNPLAEGAFGVRALPTVFVIDRAGKISASYQGQVSMARVRGWIDDALKR